MVRFNKEIMMFRVVLLVVSAYTLALSNGETDPHALSEDFINLINSKQGSWKAGRNFPLSTSLESLKKMMGAKKDPHFINLMSIEHEDEVIVDLPKNFDPRDKWPNCPTLNEVRDQGACGSCWAFRAVEAMSDRYCIYSNGTKHFHFSAEDLPSCCPVCRLGCNGGMTTLAWEYYKHFGIPGGNYNSFQGCRPYELPPCEHHVPGDRLPCNGNTKAIKCYRTCKAGYAISYKEDKKYAKHVYSIRGGEDHIRAYMFNNGPVEAVFTVFADFLTHKSGVYRHVAGSELERHAIKILGWGVEDGKKYWLITNSWNTDWRDNGFFKIVHGENHCGIESWIVAGEPLF